MCDWSRREVLAASLALAAIGGASCARGRAPLRVGLHPWPANDLYFLAAHLGYYSEEDVRLVDYASAEQGMQALRNELVEAYPCTLDEALLLAADLPDARIVQVLDSSAGADAVLAQQGIDSVRSLRGRRVGYEATALGAFVLARCLELAGLEVADVTPVFVQIDEHERAFLERRVDAIVTYEPVLGRLLAAGAHAIFDSTQIPGEIVDVLVTRSAWIESRPDACAELVGGWFEAAEALRGREQEAAAALAPRMRLPPERALAAFAGIRLMDLAENVRLLLGSPPPLLTTARRLLEAMRSHGILERTPDLGRLVDGSVVARLVAAQGGRR